MILHGNGLTNEVMIQELCEELVIDEKLNIIEKEYEIIVNKRTFVKELIRAYKGTLHFLLMQIKDKELLQSRNDRD